MSSIFDAIDIPDCDAKGNPTDEKLLHRNPAIYCAPIFDSVQDIVEIKDFTPLHEGTAAGVPSDTAAGRFKCIRGMLRHEWRLELKQEIVPVPGSPLAVSAQRAAPSVTVDSRMLFYCINCTTVQMPSSINSIPGLYDMVRAAEGAEAAVTDASISVPSGEGEAPPAPPTSISKPRR